MRVVDGLEAVEVDQQQGMIEPIVLSPEQGRLELLAEPASVRQAGQEIRAGDRFRMRHGGAQPQMSSQRQGCPNEHDREHRDGAGLEPSTSIEIGSVSVDERLEVLGEDFEPLRVNFLKVGELRPVEQRARRSQVAAGGEREGAALDGGEVTVRLAHGLGQGLLSAPTGDRASVCNRHVQLRSGLVEDLGPAALAGDRGHSGRHRHALVEAADGAAQLRDTNSFLRCLARSVTHRLRGEAERSEDENGSEGADDDAGAPSRG